MILAVDLQGFTNNEKVFFPKEIAVVSIDEARSTGHWILENHFPSSLFNAETRSRNRWLTRFHHGLRWCDGSAREKHVRNELLRLSKGAEKIYVRGECKRLYLHKFLKIEIVDLERDILNPSFAKMPRIGERCFYHSNKKFDDVHVCTLNNVLRLRQWLLEGSPKAVSPETLKVTVHPVSSKSDSR